MPLVKPAGLDEAAKPFVALRHAWGLADSPNMPNTIGIADSTILRNALYGPPVTVGDVRALLRILESVYGPFDLLQMAAEQYKPLEGLTK